MRRVALAATLAAALGGCATSRPAFRCEANGGRPWRAVYSTHFVVVTDLDSEDARDLARELDRVRTGVASSLFRNRHDPPVRPTVIAFRSTADFESFAPREAAAYYASGASDPKIVMPGSLGTEQRRVLAHEIAHHVSSYVLLRDPRWFSEGLATWAETIGVTAGGGRMVTEALPPGRRPMTRPQRIPAARLLAWDGSVPVAALGAYYDAAWLLVHFLMSQEPDRLGAFEARLAGAEDPDEAFRAAFPEWDPRVPGALDLLDGQLDAWARNGRFQGRPVQVDPPPEVSELPVATAEVHAVRLLLWGGGRRAEGADAGDEEARRRELAEALVEDPAHPVLLRLQARMDGVDPLPLARLSVKGRPGDARAWSFLAESLPPGDLAEREAALRRAAELGPENPLALSALARLLVEEGRSGEALPPARKAVQLSPFSPEVLDTYGTVSADLGNCPQAVLAARRAIDVYPDGGNAEGRQRLEDRLAGYEARCGVHRP
jgi:tetratricopeptide (TPR) repeat protein